MEQCDLTLCWFLAGDGSRILNFLSRTLPLSDGLLHEHGRSTITGTKGQLRDMRVIS
jgi:hypothetical protein